MISERKHFLEKVNIMEKLGLGKDGLYLVLRGKLTGCVGKWSWLRLDTCLSNEDIDKLSGGAWNASVDATEQRREHTEQTRNTYKGRSMLYEPWCVEHFSFAESLDNYGSHLTVRAFDNKVDKVKFEYVSDNYDMYIVSGNSGSVIDINKEAEALYLSGFDNGELGLDSLIPGISIEFVRVHRYKVHGHKKYIIYIKFISFKEDRHERLGINFLFDGTSRLRIKSVDDIKSQDSLNWYIDDMIEDRGYTYRAGRPGVPFNRHCYKLADIHKSYNRYGLIIGHQTSIDFVVENDYSTKLIDISLWPKIIDVGKNIDIIITREYNGEVIDTIKINNSHPEVLRDKQSSFIFGNWIFISDVSDSVVGLCRYKLMHKQGTADFIHEI